VIDGLGVGGFATVVKVEETQSKYVYAMKVISKKRVNCKENRDRLKLELTIMQTATSSSPFLQHCFDAFENSANVFFVVELINGGDLFFHLTERLAANPNSGKGFQEDEARVLLAEIYLGLEHLHSQGYVHRDVKIENIMINRNGHVKIVDYGLAVKLESEVQYMKAIGSVIYMAPELIQNNVGGRFTDWWAYGILAHELLTGRIPWSSLTDSRVIAREIKTMHVCPPRNTSAVASQFVLSLLKHDIDTRLGTLFDAQIKKCNFFKSINWEKTAQLKSTPAFIPGSICVAESDRVESINMYNEVTGGGGVDARTSPTFMLGLEDAAPHLEQRIQ
jgi:serine/threonine protein kinase